MVQLSLHTLKNFAIHPRDIPINRDRFDIDFTIWLLSRKRRMSSEDKNSVLVVYVKLSLGELSW